MPNTLASPEVAARLTRLFSEADAKDPGVLASIQKEADARHDGQRYHPSLTHLFDQAFMPVPPEVGQFLYVLTRSRRPATIVEVGHADTTQSFYYAEAGVNRGLAEFKNIFQGYNVPSGADFDPRNFTLNGTACAAG